MPSTSVEVLAHLMGFLIGAALYGMLLGLVVRRRASTYPEDWLPALTAVLGLVWNVSGLAAYAIRDFAGRDPDPLLIATAYSALGFLPAVVVHTVLRPQSRHQTRRVSVIVIWIAYATSTLAETVLFWSARHGIAPDPVALQILTWSYVLLMAPVLLLTKRSRTWSLLALAVFAVSALHLSHHVAAEESWLELVGHHASIPLIFAILYQDFRFALADLFLKRAIALFTLVTIAAALYGGVEVPLLARHDFRGDPVAIGVSIIVWVLLALSYPVIRRLAATLVDRLVLGRPDYAILRRRVTDAIGSADSESAVHQILRAELRSVFPSWVMELPTAEEPRDRIRVGGIDTPWRLLSDDSALLQEIAGSAARRIDALRLSRERHDRSLHEQEMSKLATEAELRALRAQINPHFLFNALNTVGYLIQTAPSRAHETLMKLTALLRGVLRTTTASATLGDEIDLVGAYLEIERARFEERLRVVIDVPAELRAISVPPLVLQPLVENAIKHGIAGSRAGGEIDILAKRSDRSLTLTVRNTGATTTETQIASGRSRGVGLTNLDARLRNFADTATLTLRATAHETVAEVALPI